MEFILASKSPRRKELLSLILPRFDCEPSDADESAVTETDPGKLCSELARIKCLAVAEKHPGCCVIGSDTVVAAPDGEILGKPADFADALRMLRLLSGRTHRVCTGVRIEGPAGSSEFCCTTLVHFRELTEEEMTAYASTPDPYDKAGGYGIQSGASVFCSGIEGDYFNVMGLPVCSLYCELKRLQYI